MAWTVLALAWGLAAAEAGPFEPVRSRDALPAREVERSQVTPMGWTRGSANSSWTSWEPPGWADRSERDLGLDLRHGLTRRLEGWLDLAVATHVRARSRRRYFEGGRFGLRGVIAQRATGGSWLAWELGYRSPWDPVGAPTPSTELGLVFRQRAGALRIDARLAGGAQLPGYWGGGHERCMLSVDRGWAGWGWTSVGSLDGLLQAGPLLGLGGLRGGAWTDRVVTDVGPRLGKGTLVGCSGGGLEDVAGIASGGWSVDASAGGGLQLSRGLQARVVVELPVAAEREQDPRVHGLTGPRTTATVEIAF